MAARVLFVLIAAASISLSAGQTVTYDARRAAAMHDDLAAVRAVQAAVIRGDLDAVVPPARALASLSPPDGFPDAAAAHVRAINRSATEALAARDATQAAVATARMLASCGSCHRAVGTMPAVAALGMPSVGGTVGHMLEHQRAIDQMMRGLVIPSDREWREGARALRAAPLHSRELPRDATLGPALLRMEEAVHRMAEEAVAAETLETRVRAYSTVLARCAACHSLHQKIWGPPSD